MKTFLVLIALSLPSLSSAAEFLEVDCYISQGRNMMKTFDGKVFGTMKTVGDRIIIEGQPLVTHAVHRPGTPDTCRAAMRIESDSYGNSYEIAEYNVTVFEFDYSLIELSCASGSVVKRYGNLGNFKKAMEASVRRDASMGQKPLCLDFTGIE